MINGEEFILVLTVRPVPAHHTDENCTGGIRQTVSNDKNQHDNWVYISLANLEVSQCLKKSLDMTMRAKIL